MPRLFVAIDLPDAQAAALRPLRDDALEGARWTPRVNYHLTLRFIGDVSDATAESVQSALTRIDADALPVKAGGLDVFPSRRKPRVLVLRVHNTPGLMNLQSDVEAGVQAAELGAEERPFIPHITFGRLKRATPHAVRAYLQERQGFELDPFFVTAFHLYESELHPDGARHQKVAMFQLR